MTESKIKPLILILSDQAFLRQQPIDILKSRIADEGFFDFNYESFDIGTHQVSEIINAANTVPFASAHRLILVNGIERANKDELEALAQYAKSPNDSSIFVVIGTKLLKTSKLYKAMKEKGDVLERKAPTRKELPSIITSLFKKEGIVANYEVSLAMLNMVGENLTYINQAVARLALYLGERKQLEIEDIAEALSSSAEIKPWEFTNALAARDRIKALQIYNEAINQGISELMLHSMTVKLMRELITCRSLIERGEDDIATVSKKLSKPDWMARRLLDQSRRFSPQELREIYLFMAEIEEKFKSGGDKRLLSTQLIMKF